MEPSSPSLIKKVSPKSSTHKKPHFPSKSIHQDDSLMQALVTVTKENEVINPRESIDVLDNIYYDSKRLVLSQIEAVKPKLKRESHKYYGEKLCMHNMYLDHQLEQEQLQEQMRKQMETENAIRDLDQLVRQARKKQQMLIDTRKRDFSKIKFGDRVRMMCYSNEMYYQYKNKRMEILDLEKKERQNKKYTRFIEKLKVKSQIACDKQMEENLKQRLINKRRLLQLQAEKGSRNQNLLMNQTYDIFSMKKCDSPELQTLGSQSQIDRQISQSMESNKTATRYNNSQLKHGNFPIKDLKMTPSQFKYKSFYNTIDSQQPSTQENKDNNHFYNARQSAQPHQSRFTKSIQYPAGSYHKTIGASSFDSGNKSVQFPTFKYQNQSIYQPSMTDDQSVMQAYDDNPSFLKRGQRVSFKNVQNSSIEFNERRNSYQNIRHTIQNLKRDCESEQRDCKLQLQDLEYKMIEQNILNDTFSDLTAQMKDLEFAAPHIVSKLYDYKTKQKREDDESAYFLSRQIKTISAYNIKLHKTLQEKSHKERQKILKNLNKNPLD